MSGLLSERGIPPPEAYANPRERILRTWIRRKDQAVRHRRQFEGQWMQSGQFGAGKQWIEYRQRLHRVLTQPLPEGRSRQTADVLNRYVWTVIGELASAEFRPTFLFSQEHNVQARDIADVINDAVAYGWDNEWHGDEKIHDLLLKLVIYGTAGVRCRFDKTKGPIVARDVVHVDDRPLLPGPRGPSEDEVRVRDEAFRNGTRLDTRVVREGRVVWEVLSPFNLLPPPGVEHADEFPWEIVARPVTVDEVRRVYGTAAAGVRPAPLESLDGHVRTGDTGGSAGKLEEHVLLYTGYKRPDSEHPDGQTTVFTDEHLLDDAPKLPYPENGAREASTGVTYFTYWPIPGRFWGRAFIEPGIGPQRIRNKRLTQNDDIIDRSLPKVYVKKGDKVRKPTGLPLEVIQVDGQPPTIDKGAGPGEWMYKDIALQDENIEKVLGINLVSLGSQPAGQQTYSGLVLLKESDRKKIGPVEDRLQLGIIALSCDTLEAMRLWPPRKLMMIEGEGERLKVLEFQGTDIPLAFLASPAKGQVGPHSPAAELAKVNEVWTARLQMGPPDRAWLDWYTDSLKAGKMLDLPQDTGQAEHVHKAALENLAMQHTSQVAPVAPYDNHELHVGEHNAEQLRLGSLVAIGDQMAQAAIDVIEQHKQQHLLVAQQTQPGAATPPGPPPPGPPA